MLKQSPFMAVLTMTGAALQMTSQTQTVPAAPTAPNPSPDQPNGNPSEPVTALGMRIVPMLMQEVEFRANPGNTGPISIGVVINGAPVYGIVLSPGQVRLFDNASIHATPVDLTEMVFLGTAADKLHVNGLRNRR